VRFLLRAGYLLIASALIVGVVTGFRREQLPPTLAVFVWVAFWPFATTLSGYVQARQWEKLNPAGNRTVTITVSEDAFRSASYVGSTDVRWAAVKQAVETREFLLVYVTDRIAHYVPKRAIADGGLPRVRRIISSRVDRRHVRLFTD
jgi:hypothetical protein